MSDEGCSVLCGLVFVGVILLLVLTVSFGGISRVRSCVDNCFWPGRTDEPRDHRDPDGIIRDGDTILGLMKGHREQRILRVTGRRRTSDGAVFLSQDAEVSKYAEDDFGCDVIEIHPTLWPVLRTMLDNCFDTYDQGDYAKGYQAGGEAAKTDAEISASPLAITDAMLEGCYPDVWIQREFPEKFPTPEVQPVSGVTETPANSVPSAPGHSATSAV